MKQSLLLLTADCREGQEGTHGRTCKLGVRPAAGSWQAAQVPVSFDCGDNCSPEMLVTVRSEKPLLKSSASCHSEPMPTGGGDFSE